MQSGAGWRRMDTAVHVSHARESVIGSVANVVGRCPSGAEGPVANLAFGGVRVLAKWRSLMEVWGQPAKTVDCSLFS